MPRKICVCVSSTSNYAFIWRKSAKEKGFSHLLSAPPPPLPPCDISDVIQVKQCRTCYVLFISIFDSSIYIFLMNQPNFTKCCDLLYNINHKKEMSSKFTSCIVNSPLCFRYPISQKHGCGYAARGRDVGIGNSSVEVPVPHVRTFLRKCC
jgi:hypothetical protein